jgi:hypothetical protein
MERDLMRYTLQLEMLERNGALSDQQATDLLHSEFALALNASRFVALTADDIEVDAISRGTPQEGVTRYGVELYLEERTSGLDDEQAMALLRRALQDALNASYFLRVCVDDLTVKLVARAPVGAPARLRAPA